MNWVYGWIAILLSAHAPVHLGSDKYGKANLESLEISGTIKLNGTTVLKRTKITGNIIANGAHLHEVDVIGDAQFTDSQIEKEIQVIGSLKARRSEFHQPIRFIGQRVSFSNCKLSGITIQRDAAFKAKQVLELKEATYVDGPIVFEGGGGEVHLYFGSKIHGTVSGGKIVQKR